VIEDFKLNNSYFEEQFYKNKSISEIRSCINKLKSLPKEQRIKIANEIINDMDNELTVIEFECRCFIKKLKDKYAGVVFEYRYDEDNGIHSINYNHESLRYVNSFGEMAGNFIMEHFNKYGKINIYVDFDINMINKKTGGIEDENS
jgi:hypothetical protein